MANLLDIFVDLFLDTFGVNGPRNLKLTATPLPDRFSVTPLTPRFATTPEDS